MSYFLSELGRGLNRWRYSKRYWNGFDTKPEKAPNGKCQIWLGARWLHKLLWRYLWSPRTTCYGGDPMWWHCNICDQRVEGSDTSS